jgi:hypothetical protein
MTPDATEVYLREYEQTLGTYRFTYQTIWQAGSVFISASAAIIAIAVSDSGGVDLGLLFAAPGPFWFWWWGVYRPMNRYGEEHSTRAATLEAVLNTRVPELEMSHFIEFDAKRKTHKGWNRLKSLKWVWRPRVSEVVNTVGFALIAADVVLVLFEYVV